MPSDTNERPTRHLPRKNARSRGIHLEQRSQQGDPILEILSEVGRDALLGLRACSEQLQADTEANANARMRIDLGLTKAARHAIQACRTLPASELNTLVEHARNSGLVQKRSTPVGYALMRIACGAALTASTVSRAAALIRLIVESGEDLDVALPPNAPFWRQYDIYCSKKSDHRGRRDDCVPLLLARDLMQQLRDGAPIVVAVTWDAKRRSAIGQAPVEPLDAASVTHSAVQAHPLPAARLLAYEPAIPHFQIEVGVTEDGENGASDQQVATSARSSGCDDVELLAHDESLSISRSGGGTIDGGVDAAEASEAGADPFVTALERASDEMVESCTLFSLTGTTDPVHVVFDTNLKRDAPDAFNLLGGVGRWSRVQVAGTRRFAWRGALRPEVRDVMERHGGRIVSPDGANAA